MTTELLQQVRIIDPASQTDKVADVSIVDGYVKTISERISDIAIDTKIHDARGLVLGTGLVDLYSHSGEPGREQRDTLNSLLLAAAAGGFTRVSILPDTSPPIDNSALVGQLLQKSNDLNSPLSRNQLENRFVASSLLTMTSFPRLNIWGALTLDVAGKQMVEVADLAAIGVVGFADGKPLENLGLLRRILEYLKPMNKPIAIWPCDRNLASSGVMREGKYSIRFGLPGNPATSETTALAGLLELVATTGTPVHLMRISTARSVELIATAKQKGLPITASTTWMHLLLDTSSIESYNQNLRLEPPLGNPEDLIALRQGVRTGIIDGIAIDHSPYSYEEKTVSFSEAPPGAIGLELALALLWENLVETNKFTALELWKALSKGPAECLNQDSPAIFPGQKAELTLFNPEKIWKVDTPNLYTLSKNTPWLGQKLKGKVMRTWC